jgi:hypothetical protein
MDYFQSKLEAIKERPALLLERYDEEDQLIPPDVWFCFEEARHTIMMGDFVACIIMCAVTVERHLAKLLEMPYYAPADERSALIETGEKLIKIAKAKRIIDGDLETKLLELNKLQNDFVHGIDSHVHARPQTNDPIKNAFMWTEKSILDSEIEHNARKAVKTLFEARKRLHYSRLNYY